MLLGAGGWLGSSSGDVFVYPDVTDSLVLQENDLLTRLPAPLRAAFTAVANSPLKVAGLIWSVGGAGV